MLCMCLVSMQVSAQFQWPDGIRAAVSLAYDDALDSHLDTALPELNRYGFHASFYLTLNSPTIKTRLNEWRLAARQGHELGNHSINHPCRASLPERSWVEPHNNLDTLSVAAIVQEIHNANVFLLAIDGETQRTFTPPCGDSRAQDGNYLTQLTPLFVAIRRQGKPLSDMQQLQLHDTPTWFAINPSLQELKDYVKAAETHGSLASITFHGVGGDYLAVDADVHKQFLAWLDNHRDRYWVESFITLSRYIHAQQSVH
ncbi:polysaccharide deacetylase family protein [Lacimicrobium sp. SS2-24]|uniref:polysaccharide deacetylase family protein n=1 Tax=Lacimicrobium sp. SS2-24 TaxID=2005569 RepID=UPI001439E95B|nr:polysaccharide deacetylase family protein [Lacimicrobium sp. SS2-24]